MRTVRSAAHARNRPRAALAYLVIAIVVALLVLATRVAAGHPHAPDRDEPATGATVDEADGLDDMLDTLDPLDDSDHAAHDDSELDDRATAGFAGAPGAPSATDGSILDRIDMLDLAARGDLDRLPLFVDGVPSRRPAWLGRLDVGIAWRRRIDVRVRSLEALPTETDQLWVFATWSR